MSWTFYALDFLCSLLISPFGYDEFIVVVKERVMNLWNGRQCVIFELVAGASLLFRSVDPAMDDICALDGMPVDVTGAIFCPQILSNHLEVWWGDETSVGLGLIGKFVVLLRKGGELR